jgi:hypothetical protein
MLGQLFSVESAVAEGALIRLDVSGQQRPPAAAAGQRIPLMLARGLHVVLELHDAGEGLLALEAEGGGHQVAPTLRHEGGERGAGPHLETSEHCVHLRGCDVLHGTICKKNIRKKMKTMKESTNTVTTFFLRGKKHCECNLALLKKRQSSCLGPHMVCGKLNIATRIRNTKILRFGSVIQW